MQHGQIDCSGFTLGPLSPHTAQEEARSVLHAYELRALLLSLKLTLWDFMEVISEEGPQTQQSTRCWFAAQCLYAIDPSFHLRYRSQLSKEHVLAEEHRLFDLSLNSTTIVLMFQRLLHYIQVSAVAPRPECGFRLWQSGPRATS